MTRAESDTLCRELVELLLPTIDKEGEAISYNSEDMADRLWLKIEQARREEAGEWHKLCGQTWLEISVQSSLRAHALNDCLDRAMEEARREEAEAILSICGGEYERFLKSEQRAEARGITLVEVAIHARHAKRPDV